LGWGNAQFGKQAERLDRDQPRLEMEELETTASKRPAGDLRLDHLRTRLDQIDKS